MSFEVSRAAFSMAQMFRLSICHNRDMSFDVTSIVALLIFIVMAVICVGWLFSQRGDGCLRSWRIVRASGILCAHWDGV